MRTVKHSKDLTYQEKLSILLEYFSYEEAIKKLETGHGFITVQP